MAMNERVHPACVNASNPYHECGVSCLEKISHAHPRSSINKNKKPAGSILGFGNKKNAADSRPQSPAVAHIASPVKAVKPTNSPSPRSPLSARKRTESDNSRSSFSSHQQSEENNSQYRLGEGFILSSEMVPVSEIDMTDDPDSPTTGSITRFAFGTLAIQKENGKLSPSPPKSLSSPASEIVEEASTPVVKSMDFSYSEVAEESDLEDSISVVSDSYVAVGKYRVRPNVASTLESIMEKYGDIAANSRLESASLRAYHLECLCSVVIELQSTPFKQLTKANVKEMLAVLKDVESVEVDVSWLRQILNERSEVIDINNQYQAAEEGQVECLCLIQSTKKELELLTEDLAKKEKEIVEAKARIEDTKAHLEELELEFSRLSDTISSTKLKLGKLHSKPLAEGIL